jgi:NAD(P)-dependent dehydrogenase (short-subunit alcohol dehydrogenase family)
VANLVDRAVEAFGGVDVLVNNAGQALHVPLMDVALDYLVAIGDERSRTPRRASSGTSLYTPLPPAPASAPEGVRARGVGE